MSILWKCLTVCRLPALALLALLPPGGLAAASGAMKLPTVSADAPSPGDESAPYGKSFRVLCYHDVRDRLRENMAAWPDATAVDTFDLVQQFAWLKENGYHPVSLDAILAARDGGPRLPPKAVLLTFDDGYASLYTRVYPLLKLFRFPAVIGLVGEWLEDTPDGTVVHGTERRPRTQFVAWSQVREMLASGLIEVASHSHSLHRGLPSNREGSQPPAAFTRRYDDVRSQYEDDASYFERVRADLARNSELIVRETGSRPRVMIWPYGAYSGPAIAAARDEGMSMTMTLEPGPNTEQDSLSRIRRTLVYFHHTVADLKSLLREPAELDGDIRPMRRAVRLALDDVFDPDARVQERKVGALIERIHRLRINTVFLKAYASEGAAGNARLAYFPNRHLAIRADLFNRVAWQLRMRANVVVYAWLPANAYAVPDSNRLQTIQEISEDLAKNTPVFGLLLQDEDCVDSASDAETAWRAAMAGFKLHQPGILTAGGICGSPSSGPTLSGRLASILRTQDFAVLSLAAVPKAKALTEGSLTSLVETLSHTPGVMQRTIFEVPTFYEPTGLPIATERLVRLLRALQGGGARNIGYGPDRFELDHPALTTIRQAISLETNPGHRP